MESPTYPNALAALAARRARITTHGLDAATGWDGELLLGALRQTRPRLAYVIPEFQNPTGHLMPADLRERLVAAAHATGTELVVDESFVDLPLDGTPMPPPVAVFDRHSRVVSIGGMSKAYWGGLRIGWVRASAPLVQRLAALRVGVDMASPVLEQLVAVHLLADAETIVADRRGQLAFRRDALVAALGEMLPEWRFVVPRGGVTLWAELDGPISSALARAAEDVGVRLAPGPAVRPGRHAGTLHPAAVHAVARRPDRGGTPDRLGPARPGPRAAARPGVPRRSSPDRRRAVRLSSSIRIAASRDGSASRSIAVIRPSSSTVKAKTTRGLPFADPDAGRVRRRSGRAAPPRARPENVSATAFAPRTSSAAPGLDARGVGAQDHLGIEQGEQRGEVAAAGGGQEGVHDRTPAGSVPEPIGARRRGPLHPAPAAAGQLPGRGR